MESLGFLVSQVKGIVYTIKVASKPGLSAWRLSHIFLSFCYLPVIPSISWPYPQSQAFHSRNCLEVVSRFGKPGFEAKVIKRWTDCWTQDSKSSDRKTSQVKNLARNAHASRTCKISTEHAFDEDGTKVWKWARASLLTACVKTCVANDYQ